MGIVGTKQASKILGVPVSRLQQAVWHERISSPAKVNGGFVWGIEDLRRAHRALHGAPLDLSTVPAEFEDVVAILSSQPTIIS